MSTFFSHAAAFLAGALFGALAASWAIRRLGGGPSPSNASNAAVEAHTAAVDAVAAKVKAIGGDIDKAADEIRGHL